MLPSTLTEQNNSENVSFRMPRRAYQDVRFDIRASPRVRDQYLAISEQPCDAWYRSRAAHAFALPWQSADVFFSPDFVISTSHVQNGIARISNKLPRGTRHVGRRFSDKPSVIRYLRVSYESFLDPAVNIRNEVPFRLQEVMARTKSFVVAIGICAYQRFSGQVRELIFP